MINTNRWINELLWQLENTFHERLVFLGLQGSYARGEATETSDLDIVVLLDFLEIADLAQYRQIIQAMPHADKACGFIGGRKDLANWPRHDLLQFREETIAYHGSLDGILPTLEMKDIAEGVKTSAATLYHMACHTYLYSAHGSEELKAMYKAARFILQSWHYLKTGQYCKSKLELFGAINEIDKDILRPHIQWQEDADIEQLYSRIITWSGRLLRG